MQMVTRYCRQFPGLKCGMRTRGKLIRRGGARGGYERPTSRTNGLGGEADLRVLAARCAEFATDNGRGRGWLVLVGCLDQDG